MSRATTVTSRLVAGTIAALVLAACSSVSDDSNTRSMTPTDPSRSVSEFNSQRHEFRTKEFYARPGGGGRGTGITYHGGTVIAGPAVTKVVAIYWAAGSIYASQPSGTGGGSSDNSLIGKFLNHLGGSSYFNINTTYYNGSNTHVSNSVSYIDSTTDNYSRGKSLSDSDIQAIVASQNPRDTNGVYFVLTSADVTATSGFCTQYCGWHTHGTIGGLDIKYSFVGNPDRCPSSCAAQSIGPNDNAGADGMASIISHELEEAVTDPDLNAWYDRQGAENADKCAWTFGSMSTASNGSKYNMTLGSRNFLIQQNWVNSGNGFCAKSL